MVDAPALGTGQLVSAVLCRTCGELLTQGNVLRAAQDHWLDNHYGDPPGDAMFTTLDRNVVELEQMYNARPYKPPKT